MEQLKAVELQAFKPGQNQPFLTLDGSDGIRQISATENAVDAIDSASIGLEAVTRPLSDRITSGDRLEFSTQLVGQSSLSPRLTLIARDISDELTAGGGVRRVSIEATDFVFTTLSFRTAEGVFDAEPVGDVVDTLVGAEAPEVGRTQIQSTTQDITININGRKVLDVLSQDLAPAGDAIIAQQGTDLIFRPIQAVTPQFTLSPDDLHTPIRVERVDD
jgi:hypothetical protein